MATSRAQVIEAFHLVFLEVLRQKLDPTRYVLKGGANLRYFFDSVHHAEILSLQGDSYRLRDKNLPAPQPPQPDDG